MQSDTEVHCFQTFLGDKRGIEALDHETSVWGIWKASSWGSCGLERSSSPDATHLRAVDIDTDICRAIIPYNPPVIFRVARIGLQKFNRP